MYYTLHDIIIRQVKAAKDSKLWSKFKKESPYKYKCNLSKAHLAYKPWPFSQCSPGVPCRDQPEVLDSRRQSDIQLLLALISERSTVRRCTWPGISSAVEGIF